MSVIVHRCEACGHTDLSHERAGLCSSGFCKAGCRVPRANVKGPSELLTTYATLGVEVVEVTPPGTQFGTILGGPLNACGCTNCREVYDSAAVS